MPAVASVRSCPADDKLAAVDRAQQLRNIRRNHLDDMLLQRLPRVQHRGFAHSLFGPVRVAAPKLGQAADQRNGVVRRLDFDGRQRGLRGLCLVLVLALAFLRGRPQVVGRRQPRHAASADLHGRCRADIRSRRHGGDGRCIKNVSAGARGMCAGGGDVADYWDRGCQNGFDDLACAGEQAAGRIEPEDQHLRLARMRLVYGVLNIVRRCRADHARYLHEQSGAALIAAFLRPRATQRGKRDEQRQKQAMH